MAEQTLSAPTGRPAALRSALLIVVAGVALGIGYNWLGQSGRPSWGIEWLGSDPLERLAAMPQVSAASTPKATPTQDAYTTHDSDPLGAVAAAPSVDLPPFPDVGRPVQFDLSALKAYFDADAALIVDAREPVEFAESHIAGAINIPYDTAVSDPALLEALDSGGRPLIAYCGGGTCELSIKLAEELFFAGHERVAVYMGGFPEWVEAGYPTTAGGEER